ncbi:hypothetical protein GN958_ATG18363, partial [Phytophthora infestans]
QLEAIHSKLRKLLDRVIPVEVGLRILDIFILQHNVSVGARYQRNPAFKGTNFRSVVQSAVIVFPDRIAHGYKVQRYNANRGGAAPSAEHQPWERIFDMIHLRTNNVEVDILARNAPADDIRSLLSATCIKRKHLSRERFAGLLGLKPKYDAVREFSAQEFSLLKQLRAEQLASKQPWSSSEVVSTILYNCAVERLDNSALNIRKRGIRAIAIRLPGIDDQSKKKPIVIGQRIILTTDKSICDDVVTPDEVH